MKKIVCMILCLVGSLVMIGCSDKEGTAMNIYYLNLDGNALVQEEYFRQAAEDEAAIKEVLEVLKNPKSVRGFQRTIPDSVEVKKFRLRNQILELTFNDAYSKLNRSSEVLLRAAMVQTLVQLPDVTYVSFYIGDEPLKDMSGTAIGIMSEEDFVQNTGSSLKSYQESDLKLYFSNKDGTELVTERRTEIRYSINTSVEKLVVEQLMKGPSSDKRGATIPTTVKLLGVSVRDGICYVNFSSPFLTDGYNQKPEVAIYSIVNSIITNGNATKVQILVDGSSDVTFKGTIDLSDPLEWKADLIEE